MQFIHEDTVLSFIFTHTHTQHTHDAAHHHITLNLPSLLITSVLTVPFAPQMGGRMHGWKSLICKEIIL